jgi:hypothetical protein
MIYLPMITPARQFREHWYGGHRNQPFSEQLSGRGQWFNMPADSNVYLPVPAPHWFQVMRSVSVSCSVTAATLSSQTYRRRFARSR